MTEVVPFPDVPLPGEAGVQYTPPPPDIFPSVIGDIERAIATIGDADVALVAVADRKGGWNAATVARGPGGITGLVWIGKSWGTDERLNYGAKVMWKIKF